MKKCPSKSCSQIWRLEICKCSECKNQAGLRDGELRSGPFLKERSYFLGKQICVFKKEVEFEVSLRDGFGDIAGGEILSRPEVVRTVARLRGKLKARSRRSQVPHVSELESAQKELERPSGMPSSFRDGFAGEMP